MPAADAWYLGRMEFRFEPYKRRFRLRTPERHARTFASDDLFQFGIEEEYFLSDAQTLQVPSETPDALFQRADLARQGMSDGSSCSPRSRSQPSRIAAPARVGWNCSASGRARRRRLRSMA